MLVELVIYVAHNVDCAHLNSVHLLALLPGIQPL